jgi:hypothetical protein
MLEQKSRSKEEPEAIQYIKIFTTRSSKAQESSPRDSSLSKDGSPKESYR